MPRRRKRRKKRGTSGPDRPAVPELTGLARLVAEIPVGVLDLHGMTASQAQSRVRFFLERHAVTSRGKVVHIVTGKGSRSEGAAVLPGLVRALVVDDLADLVAESAGLPGGGGVAVRLI